jgi:hypothetical protein
VLYVEIDEAAVHSKANALFIFETRSDFDSAVSSPASFLVGADQEASLAAAVGAS